MGKSEFRLQGQARAGASPTFFLTVTAAIVGRLLVGVLFDRIAPAAVATGLFLLASVGAVMLALEGAAWALPAAMVLGLSVGAKGNLIAVLTARHFPAARYGQADGALYALFLVGGALGPAAIGFIVDRNGGYHVPMLAAAASLALASFTAVRLIRLTPTS